MESAMRNSAAPSPLPPISTPLPGSNGSPSSSSPSPKNALPSTRVPAPTAVKAAAKPAGTARYPPPSSATAARDTSSVDSHLSATDTRHRISDGRPRLSLSGDLEDGRASDSHTQQQHRVDESAVSEFPVALLSSSPVHRASWHGVLGLTMAGSVTQPHGYLPNRRRGSAEETSASVAPHRVLSTLSTATGSASLLSLRHDSANASSVETSPAQPSAGVLQRRTSQTALAKKERRQRQPQRRLDSAHARRVVVAQQRHRKLFELDADADKNILAHAQKEAEEDASVGWMAALTSPMSNGPHAASVDDDLSSPSIGFSMHLRSSTNTTPISATETTRYDWKSATAPPLSRSRSDSSNGSVGFRKPNASGGSSRTTVSLTSLQHRLWQHTTTAISAAQVVHKQDASEKASRGLARSLPPSPPPARTSPLPGHQRTAAASVRHGRHGQYTSGVPRAALVPECVGDSSLGGGGAVVTRSLTHPPPTAAPPMLVTQWEASLGNERMRGQQGKLVAQWLVQRLLTAAPTTDLDRSRYASLRGAADEFGLGSYDVAAAGGGTYDNEEEEEEQGGGLLQSLSERAAVAAYLLSTLVADGLPRHQQSVLPYVRMLIEFAFVPDTPAIRAALGNDTVQDEDLLDRLAQRDRCFVPFTATTTLPPSAGPHALDRPYPVSEGGEGTIVVDLMSLLAPAFTRQTYITAHFNLAGQTLGLAHEVRCRALHQRNVPRLLERTHKNWMRGLMRAVLRAWRRLCQERRVGEQRQRARWALRWTSERMRVSLRRWRGYASLRLYMAEADSVAKTALAQKRAFIDRLEREAAAMQHSSQELQRALQQQDEEREVVEGKIIQREILYQRLIQQVREVDRVGSLMLNSLLLDKVPPRFGDASMIAAVASSPASRVPSRNGSFRSFTSARSSHSSLGDSASTDSDTDEDQDEPRPLPHAVTALPTLLQWAKDCSKAAEEEYLALYPSEVADGAAGEPKSDDTEEKKKVNSGGSRASVMPAPPTHVPAGFGALLLSAASDVNVSDQSMSETVLLPMHKLLLIMRGCSGAEGGGEGVEGVAKETPLGGVNASPDLLSAALTEERAMEGDGGLGGAAVAPSFGMIRMVQYSDAAVLKEVHALVDKDNGITTSPSPTAAAANVSSSHIGGDVADVPPSPPPSGLSLMLRLSQEKREILQRICRVVIDAYEQLTGTACVVTAEQLFERSRGTLLVLLAALMRHYTNWMVRRTQQTLAPPSAPPPTDASPETSDAPPAAAAGVLAVRTGRKMNSDGVPHRRYDEWSHPPHSHRRWRGQVRRQAEWIALSFSALHDAMRVATLPSHVLTVGQQDHVSGLLERLSLTEFIDLLPNTPDQTMQCYVDMIGAVERYAPSLHLLFHEFALPLAQLRADEGAAVATARRASAATSKKQQGRSLRNDLGHSGGNAEKELYITANTLWRLLCVTGLAGGSKEAYCTALSRRRVEDEEAKEAASGGGGGSGSSALVSPPLSATLHRPAVFSVIEQVTQNGVASTAMNRRRSSVRQQSAGSPSNRARADAGAAGATPSPPVFTVSCKTRPRPCFARALRDSRHVDLRVDTGAVCVNYTQFVKVLIRLAHAWQCLQQQQEEAEHHPAARDQGDEEEYAMGVIAPTPSASAALLTRRSGAGVMTPSKSKEPTHMVSTTTGEKATRGRSASAVAAAAASTRVEYEAGNYAHTLCLPYFHAFLGDLFLPRLLGSHRWGGAAQRAMCSRPVLQLFAQHHDALLDFFNNYQHAREARGVRASLPPPYSTVLASQLFSRVVDSERQANSGLTVGGGRSMSHVQRASLMYGLSSSMNRRGSNMGLLGDGDESQLLGAGTDGSGGRGGRRNPRAQQQRRRSSISRAKRGSTGASVASPDDTIFGDNLRASIATAQRSDISIVSVLQWKDVVTLAKDMRWFSIRRLTETALRSCFEHVRADATREGDSIFFSDFLQLLCAVSSFASTSPAVPLEEKLKSFLETYVLSSSD